MPTTADFKRNWTWQQACQKEVVRVLRENAIYMLRVRIATFHEDTKQGTDMVAEVEGGKIAIRLRRPDCGWREFTLRSFNRGNLTELDKLKSGRSDLAWYLYGWMDDDGRLAEWVLVDMARLVESGLLNRTWREIPNKDGSTKFITIQLPVLRNARLIVAERYKEKGYWFKKARVGALEAFDSTEAVAPNTPAEKHDASAGRATAAGESTQSPQEAPRDKAADTKAQDPDDLPF